MSKKNALIPDHMVAKMLEDPTYWRDKLRLAAAQRGMPGLTSVTPQVDVLAYLRMDQRVVDYIKRMEGL